MEIKYDEKSCGIVVFRSQNNQNLFLVLKYPSGHFDLPKGHMEKGEQEVETAIRELIEETGITDIKVLDGFRHEISYIYKRRKKFSNKLVVFFLGETHTAEIKISDEHLDFYWLPYDEAFAKLTFDNAKNLLEKAKHFLVASK